MRIAARAGKAAEHRSLTFIVHGAPSPKGSLRHVGHGRLVEQVKGSAPWRERIVWTAVAAMDSPEPMEGPLSVSINLTVPKPASAPKKRRIWPITRSSGDLDKHCRNVLDALVDAGVMRDDSQVVHLAARKLYPAENLAESPSALLTQGAVITVRQIGAVS